MALQLKNLTLAAVCLGGMLFAGSAYADSKDAQALAEAKITLVQAIQAAEKAHGGSAFDAQIDDDSARPEFEVGIVREGRIYDVRVDALTGEVLGVREDRDD